MSNGSKATPILSRQPPSWEAIWPEIEYDGSFRDLYLLEAGPEGWRKFLTALHDWPFPCRFLLNGVQQPIPRQFDNREKSWRLEIRLGRICIFCWFSEINEIELTVDPRDATDESDLLALYEFMIRIADAVGQSVSLTAENISERTILTYNPSTGHWIFFK